MTSDRLARFRALPDSEARVLLLIAAFSGTTTRPRALEGRIKLAKLDFLVRYPKYLARVLRSRGIAEDVIASIEPELSPLEDRMIRYRYGPWDPSYYAVLGSLIGRGLVDPIPVPHGIGYRTTQLGRSLVESLLADESWDGVQNRAVLARRHLDMAGSTLKQLLYDAIPEMASADWHQELD